MPRIFSFEWFDPKTGLPPDEFFGKLKGITGRARVILKARSAEEIIAMTDVISWLMSHEQVIQNIVGSISVDDEETIDESLYDDVFDEAKILLFCVENVELDFAHEIDGLTWQELFAAHSLACIADVCKRIHENGPDPTPMTKETAPMFIGSDALDAMECVCIAESLIRQDETKQDIKKKFSLQKQEAARVRHSNTDELKEDFIHYYEAGEFPSKAEAARKFYNGLPPEKKKLLKPTNAVRTLNSALRKHLNSSG